MSAFRSSSWVRTAFAFGFCVAPGLGLFGCGDEQGSSAGAGYEIGSSTEELTKKCGVDKYDGPQGADVSSWQGDFNWNNAGVVFGYARISDGTNYIDKQFDSNWKKMKAAGILRGAYQYFEPGQSATTQANMMVDKVGKLGPGDMPALIDVEATGGQSPAAIASKVKTWLDIVEKGTGKKPIIYTGAYFWQDHVKDTSFGDYPLWIAAYGPSCPSLPAGWSNWKFWQYCNGETQYCTNGKGFDRDVFNGTKAELQKFAGGTTADYYAAEYVDQSFPLATTALTMKAGETIPAFIKLKNVGTEAWDANTRIGTTEPRDRASAFADPSWISSTRPAGVNGSVAPGATYEFTFNLHAPDEPGTYFEYFGVVEEGVVWFSDPNQGGPADNQLQAQIEVVPGDGSGGTSGNGGSGSGGDAGSAGEDGLAGTGGSHGNEQTTRLADVDGGCSVRALRGRDTSGIAALWIALGLVAGARSRRARSYSASTLSILTS